MLKLWFRGGRVAVRVGQIAFQELVDDIAGRKAYYEERGMKFDDTANEREDPAVIFEEPGLPTDPIQPE